MIRAVRLWQNRILGAVGAVEDVRDSRRSRRATRDQVAALAAAERTAALAAARRGCAHVPECPSSISDRRQEAAVIWRDQQFAYLCNGLVLKDDLKDEVPDFPPADLIPPPTTPAEDVSAP